MRCKLETNLRVCIGVAPTHTDKMNKICNNDNWVGWMKLEPEGVSSNLLYFIQSLYNLWHRFSTRCFAVMGCQGLTVAWRAWKSVNGNLIARSTSQGVSSTYALLYSIAVFVCTWLTWKDAASRFKNASTYVRVPGFGFCQTGYSEIFVVFSVTAFRFWDVVP